MKNFEKYEKEIKEGLDNSFIYNVLYELSNERLNGDEDCDVYDILKWLYEEHKEPLLTDDEKEYLKAVIKPFKNEIAYIKFFNKFIEFGKSDNEWCNIYKKKNMFKNVKLEKNIL